MLILNKMQTRNNYLELGQTVGANNHYKRWSFLTLYYPQHPDLNKSLNILLLNYSVHERCYSRKEIQLYVTEMILAYVHLVRS